MMRAIIWGCIGWITAILALAIFGAWDGYMNGWSTGRKPPGLEAAGIEAFAYTAYAWWLAGGLGAVFGGLTGLGSSLANQCAKRRKTA